MKREWIVLDILQKRRAATMSFFMKMRLANLILAFNSCTFVIAQSYTEGADLSNNAPGDTFTFMNTGIDIEGQMNTPGDGSEYFVLELPQGCQMTSSGYKIVDPNNLGISGYFQLGVNNQQSFSGGTSSGNFAFAGQFPTLAFPVSGPAFYQCQAQANIAFLSDWKIAFQGICSPCNNPSVPNLTAIPLALCKAGVQVTLNISGSLNDATSWVIYSDSCGKNLVGNTAGTSFSILPAQTTTYFVRGEGGCVKPGNCAQVTVPIGDLTAPVMACPGTQTAYLESSCEFTIPDYSGLATIADNCDSVPGISQSPSSGSVVWGNTTIILTGTDSSGNSSQCNFQLIILDTLSLLDTSITVNGNQLTANHPSAQYQWVDCKNAFSAIANDTNASCQICQVQTGTYAVIISVKGCSDTSGCFDVNVTGSGDTYNRSEWMLFPNPATEFVTIAGSPQGVLMEFNISDLQGRILRTGILEDDESKIDLRSLPSGMYLFHGDRRIVKLIKSQD